MARLAGRAAIVTGAATGIGRAIADLVTFIAGPGLRWITAQNIFVNGGTV